MSAIRGSRVVVVGGSRGLGLAVVEAFVSRGADVTVVARKLESLSAAKKRLGVEVVAGDATDPSLARQVIQERRPSTVVLTAGAILPLAPIHEQTWENFEAIWNHDVKAALFWTQEALRLPLAPGSRVLLTSSGAAVNGTPLSGGYAAAKRMVWWMAPYANDVSRRQKLGIHFQAIIPLQVIPETGVGRHAAEGHARGLGVSVESYLSRFGAPLSASQFGERVATVLCESQYSEMVAVGIHGERGIVSLDQPVP